MNNIYRKTITVLCLALLTAGGAALPAQARTRAQKVSPLSDSLRKTAKAPSRERRAAFNKFAGRHGRNWRVRYNPRTALPEALTGGKAAGYAGTPEQAAAAFFAANKDLLGLDTSALELRLKKEFGGVTHLQYQQYKDGLPVEFSYARVHVSASGEILGYQAKFEPEIPLNTTPAISAEAAVIAARMDLGRNMSVSKTELVVYPDEAEGTLKLAWKVRGRANGLWVYYVDAHSGAVLFRYDDLRYACNNNSYYYTRATSSATVYAVSPIPTYVADTLNVTEDNWLQPVKVSLRDQYVWVADYSSRTVTNVYGDYCTQKDGKMFSSLKGPYFSVSNFRNASAHYDNGGGQWRIYTHSVASPHPYANSQTYDYSVTIPNDWGPNYTFAKAMPGFSSFNVGDLDIYGSLNDPDYVRVKNGTRTEGVYLGNRTTAFFGAAVESPTYAISLITSPEGTNTGFTVNKSSYLVLTTAPNTANNTTGMVVWSTYTAGVYLDKSLGDVNALSEVNAFYHLNAIRRYFDPINYDVETANPAADLNRHVPVMVHAHGNADRMGQTCPIGDDNCGGMLNAYYDLEHDNILLGDGQVDYFNKYRSFALDGTIVRHEYIHLVINRIFPIINFGEFGAISEGLSDYFSLASFWREGETITALGTYVGAGEGAARDLSANGLPTSERKMPDDWAGEVHEDGLIIGQALYKLRRGPAQYNLDTGESAFNYGGTVLPRADIFTFAALFYFPDNFANFKDAMLDACRQLDAANCDAAMQSKIQNAFAYHGIGGDGDSGDEFEASDASGMCRSNNGPECASDVGSRTSLAATIYPLGDVDYYGIPVAAGSFAARLDLPAAAQDGTYKAYAMLLFDSDRNIAVRPDGTEAIAMPEIYNNYGGYCPNSGDCLTVSPSVELAYNVPYGGRYYLVVSAGLNQFFGNSDANSLSPYTLRLSRVPAGSATAGVYSAAFDGDDISFSVPFSRFEMNVSPSSSAVLDVSVTGTTEQSGAEFVFEYAQLRDHNYEPLEDTRTNVPAPASYLQRVSGSMSTNVDNVGRDVLTGRVRIQPGFAARYPGVGTVYLEIFGRNHLGHIVSLGVSNAINLASNRSALTAYNNILTGNGDAAIIKYEVQSAGNLSVKVYTQSGALVKTVFNGPVPAGKGTVDWDGTNSNGGKAASGIYFVKSKGPGLDKVVKVAIVR